MSGDVDVHDQSGPVLAQPRKTGEPRFATAAYQKQLDDANALIVKIIEQNLPRAARG